MGTPFSFVLSVLLRMLNHELKIGIVRTLACLIEIHLAVDIGVVLVRLRTRHVDKIFDNRCKVRLPTSFVDRITKTSQAIFCH